MLLNVLLFWNCSPQKRLSKTQEQEQSNVQEQIVANREITRDSAFFRRLCEALRQQLDIERTCERTSAEDIETLTREYDTSRPADSLTGKPPLLRETTQRQHRTDSVRDASHLRQTQTRNTYEVAEGAAQEQEQLQLRADSNRQMTTERATEEEQQRGLAWWQKTLCFVGLLTLIYAFYRIYNKH